jgi:hypothetical protein
MNNKWIMLVAILVMLLSMTTSGVLAQSGSLAPMGTGFTYQGQLKDSAGNLINGNCDFRFILYDAEISGAQVGSPLDKTNISVMKGNFTVGLDFGNSAFLGDARWLEVAVRCPAGSGSYTTLTPRQALTAAPYALNTDLLDGQHATAFSTTGHTHWGQSWAGSGNGLALLGGTTGLTAIGSEYGVFGRSDSTSGVGIKGGATATSGFTYGVFGQADSTFGKGVYGNAASTSGSTYGVFGESYSTYGTGVYGGAIATSGSTYGVFGESYSTSGTGVYGSAIATSGVTYGVYGSSDSTTGTGIYGHSQATTGTTNGVIGRSDSTSGTGVYGLATATNGSTYGVYGSSNSTTGVAGYFSNTSGSSAFIRGWGVRAFTGVGAPGDLHPNGFFYPGAVESAGPNGVIGAASSDASDGYGVLGLSAGTYGRGVSGRATASSGSTYGVSGQSDSTSGTGVYGYAAATSGTTNGVFGRTTADTGAGVRGWASASTGTAWGVFGQSDSTAGTGVYGINTASNGTTYGIFGISESTSGIGLYGNASATTGLTYGVYGVSASDNGTGVYGYTSSTSGFGVRGYASQSGSVTTSGAYGRSDANNGFGIAGHAWLSGVGVGAWSYAGNLIEAFSGDYPGGTLEFYITQAGNVYANGTYNSYKASSIDGATHAVSAIQSPEVWVEDFGRASLVDGKAVVSIATDFAGIANLSVDYNVFLTPMGDSFGLYVTNLTSTSFEVHEQNGGKSNITFSYRIVAKQAGSETIRLPEVTIPATIDVPRQTPEENQPGEQVQLPQLPQAPAPLEQGQAPN